MLHRNLLILVLLLCSVNCLAQPGGGGGLRINKLYDDNLQAIASEAKALEIAAYTLTHKSEAGLILAVNEGKWNDLPPTLEDYNMGYFFHRKYQRIYIKYKKTRMIIDFWGVLDENAAGMMDFMDSLVVMEGHYVVVRDPQEIGVSWSEITQEEHKVRGNGLTPHSLIVQPNSFIVLEKKIRKAHFKQRNFDTLYFYFEGRRQNIMGNFEEAQKMYKIALDKNIDKKFKEQIYIHSFFIANSKNDLTEAKKWLDLLLENHRSKKNRTLEVIYLTKIEEKQKALKILKKIGTPLEIAAYYAEELEDYENAAAVINKVIRKIPATHLSDRPQGKSEYAHYYFILGDYEYKQNKVNSAANHWLKAMEFGYAQSSSTHTVSYFDTILLAYPDDFRILMARGIAHYKRSPYLGWGDATHQALDLAIADYRSALALNPDDYRIYYHYANALLLKKLYSDALENINQAISRNPNDPRLYLTRSRIKSKGNIEIETAKADHTKYLELAKEWIFEEY